jgi:hypothetical protein
MNPIAGFLPDVDPTTPAILADCTNLIPYQSGYEGAPSRITPSGVPALAAACRGSVVAYKLDDTRRFFAGTATKLYELSAGVWADVSDTGDYTGGADTVWSFTQFGDATIASNGIEPIQRTTSGDFAAIAGAPDAKIVFSVASQVMALNVNDGAVKQDGWHCCAVFDDTDWTPDVATQAASGRLVGVAGPITAGGRIGNNAIAYKARAIFRGIYVGAPSVWQWEQVIGGEAGCIGQDAWCDIGGAHFAVGETDFWLFDGNVPQPIGEGVRQWFFSRVSPSYLYKTRCIFDRQTNRVWVFYPSSGSSTLDSVLVWHITSRKWGRADQAIEAPVNYIASGATIDGFGGTIDALPDVSFDSQYWLAGGRALSVFDASHQLQALTGQSATSSFTTGDVGDDWNASLLQEVRLRFATAPTSANITTYCKLNSGTSWSAGESGAMSDGKFDVLCEGRWHKADASFVGPVQITGMAAKIKPAGVR